MATAKKAKKVQVQALSEQGRWRCGKRFTREPVSIEVSDEEHQRLLADPQLKVTDA